MTTPRERQVEEFMRRLEAGEINLANGRVTDRAGLRELVRAGDYLEDRDFRVALVSHAPSLADKTLLDFDDVIVAIAPLSNVTVVDGALDASDLTFHAVVNSAPVVGAVILANNQILGYTPLPAPVVLTGSSFTVMWDNGPNRIMRL